MNGLLNLRTLLAAGLLAGTCPIAQAADDVLTSKKESHFLPWEKGSITLGGFLATFDDSIDPLREIHVLNQPGFEPPPVSLVSRIRLGA